MAGTGRSREWLDGLLAGSLTAAAALTRLLPTLVARSLFRCVVAFGVTVTWPLSSIRSRAAMTGLAVRPWRWGWSAGGNLAALCGAPGPLVTTGFPEGPVPAVVLAAHSGPWEAGAAELARRGLRPLVIAAAWPRLPRTQSVVRDLRERLGVRALPRGRATAVEATHHLRSGGWVIVLVDSLNPRRDGRRPLPFVDEPIGAPDGLVGWAARQGAAVLLARAEADTFALRLLLDAGQPRRHSPAVIRGVSDEIVASLRLGARARPWEWAWVRALATLAVALLAGCPSQSPLPPLPLNPAAWRADIDGFRWEGEVQSGGLEFRAGSARVRNIDDTWVGAFEDIEFRWEAASRDVVLRGGSAVGTFPTGPLTVREATYSVDGVSGETPTLRWLGGRQVTCSGCPLETLVAEGAP